MELLSNPTCPYCGQPAVLTTGLLVYPHRIDLFSKLFYYCRKDDAYVGCHPGTTNPLGRLANAELREKKQAAHAAFDPLWKNTSNRQKERSRAYQWLSIQLGINPNDCHIGMFDVETCEKVVAICSVHSRVPRW